MDGGGLDLEGTKWPDAQIVMKLAEKRVIICDEGGIEEDMNYNNIKRWTSNPPVQSGGMSAHLSQTIIGISNKMGFAVRGAINSSIGRRVVIYKMDKELGKLKPFPAQAVNDYVKMQFISACLSVLGLCERAPMSLEIALYTFSRRSVNFITARDHNRIPVLGPPLHRVHGCDGHQDRSHDRPLGPVLRRVVEQARVHA